MSDNNIIISDVCRAHFTLKGINLLQHAEDVRLREIQLAERNSQ